ncbi:MAG: ABC transporter permease [Thermoplasmata archaeon]
MVLYKRVSRNLFRRPLWTLGVALIVGLSIGGFLIFSQITSAIDANVNTLQSQVKDLISVESTTSVYHEPVNAPMTDSSIEGKIDQLTGIVAVQRVFYENFNGGAIVLGGSPPVEGIDVTTGGSLLNIIGSGTAAGSPYTMTDGRNLQPSDQGSLVAVIPAGYASSNNIPLGGSVSANGTSFTVVGFYTTGSSYANAAGSIIVPYSPAASDLQVPGPNVLYVTVDTSSSVFSVVNAIQTTLGSGYQVQPLSNLGSAGNTLTSIANSNELEEYLSLVVGVGVIGLVTFLITSQRKREIGLLKAIGFKDGTVASQLTLESVLWSTIGLPLAFAVTLLLGPFVLQSVIQSANAGGTQVINGHSVSTASSTLSAITFGLTPSLILLAVAVTLGIGVAGALYPVIRAIRMSPAEALRHV